MASYPNTDKKSARAKVFYEMSGYTNKPLAVTECGGIPDIENMLSENSLWLWWMTWYTDFVYKSVNGRIVVNEEHTPASQLRKNYSSQYVVTLEDLTIFCDNGTRQLPKPILDYMESGRIMGENPRWENQSLLLEFENSKIVGSQIRCGNTRRYSGFGCILYRGINNGIAESAMFEFDAPKSGEYTAEIQYIGEYGEKRNTLYVNDMPIPLVFPGTSDGLNPSTVTVDIRLKEGPNTLGFKYTPGDDGWVFLDCIKLKLNSI